MSFERNGISLQEDVREIPGWPRLVAGEGGLTGERKFRVSYAKLQRLYKGLKGNPRRNDPPEYYPGHPHLLCTSIEVQPQENTRGASEAFTGGVAKDKSKMTYEWYHVLAKFSMIHTVRYRDSVQIASAPSGNFFFLGSQVEPVAASTILLHIPVQELTVSRKLVSKYDPNLIAGKKACVNHALWSPFSMDDQWRKQQNPPLPRVFFPALKIPLTESEVIPGNMDFRGHPPGCVLFMGCDVEARVDAFGEVYWDVNYNFAVRPEYAPWNKFPRLSRALQGSTQNQMWDYLHWQPSNPNLPAQILEPYKAIDFRSLA